MSLVTDGMPITAYNFEVADFHTYYVLQEGKKDGVFAVWVHNARCKKSSFSRDILNALGPKPIGMVRAHIHHILFEIGKGAAQRRLVREGKAILKEVGINHKKDIRNLVWAPNIKGQHTEDALREVVDALKNAKLKHGTSSSKPFEAILEFYGSKAANRK